MEARIFMNFKNYKNCPPLKLRGVRGVIRIAFSVIAGALLIFLFVQDYQPDGTLEVSSNFSEPTSYFSNYGPRESLGPKEFTNGQFARRVNGRMIGFDVRLPRWFKNAEAHIIWKSADGAYEERIESIALPVRRASFEFPENATLPIHIASIKIVAHR